MGLLEDFGFLRICKKIKGIDRDILKENKKISSIFDMKIQTMFF